MYAIKGSWVGQTLALATSSDSGGRKSRIRRSKEERKAMVESFVNKYQKLNNGNFPSLNLTHKEVGGSFYTVREIVREIIQENRVLGPAKFPTEEHNNNKLKLLEQFPLGSISIEPTAETDVTSLVTPNQYDCQNEEDISNNNGQPSESEHHRLFSDSEHVVNGYNVVKADFNSEVLLGVPATSYNHQISNADQLWSAVEKFNRENCQEFNNEEVSIDDEAIEEEEESGEPILVSAMPIPCHEMSQECDQEADGEQVLCSGEKYPENGHLIYNAEDALREISQELKITSECGEKIDTREVAGDTLSSAIVETNNVEVSNGRSDETDVLVEKFPLRPIAKSIHDFEVPLGDQTNIPKTLEAKGIKHEGSNSSLLVVVEDVLTVAGPRLENTSEPLQEKALLNIGDLPLENSELSATKETLGGPISSLVGEKPVNVTQRTNNEKNLNSVSSGMTSGQHIPEENSVTKSKLNTGEDISNKEKNSSTLDRINLQTWEGASQKPAGLESNPLLSVLKAFIAAFVKFWTE